MADGARARCWLVLTFGDDRTYVGNDGYLDDPRQIYRYDSDVQNHKQIAAGDVFIIRDREHLIGLAAINEIQKSAATKIRRRCPTCGTTALLERTAKQPRFRCARKHEFQEPTLESDACVSYEARFGAFVDAADAVSLTELRAACPKYSEQPSIQLLDPDGIRWGLATAAPQAAALLPVGAETPGGPLLLSGDADESADISSRLPVWTPHEDERERVIRSLRVRRGQAAFRRVLAERYGPKCMISGCCLFDIVEAAHIAPYRGAVDNARTNGLLLRSDLHTLFDLDLLGIEPDSLTIQIHPSAAQAGYAGLIGGALACGKEQPGAGPLRARWTKFLERLQLESESTEGVKVPVST